MSELQRDTITEWSVEEVPAKDGRLRLKGWCTARSEVGDDFIPQVIYSTPVVDFGPQWVKTANTFYELLTHHSSWRSYATHNPEGAFVCLDYASPVDLYEGGC